MHHMKTGFALTFVLSLAFGLSASGAMDGLSDLSRAREGRSMWTSSANRDAEGRILPTRNGDAVGTIRPGETFVMADLEGPGIIQHIWMTIYLETYSWARKGWSPEGTANPQEVMIRMYWDGREHPDVEAPLGDFFASGFGENMEVKSTPVVVEDGDAYNCYWPMPFRKSARIEIENQSTQPIKLLYFNVDWIRKKRLSKDTLYFCAQYRQEYPAAPDQEYTILEAEGRGHYVGTVLSVRTRSPGWFGEGDMRMVVDGDTENPLWGTGTEDYFLSAWGLAETSTPYFGVPYLNQGARNVDQRTCMYRWHLSDAIVFQKSLKVAIETLSWLTADENAEADPRYFGQRTDDLSSVAFWYQDRPPKRFTTVPPAARRRLPDIARIRLEGSDFGESKYHGKGKVTVQRPIRDQKSHLYFDPESMREGWIEFPFTIEKKEPLRLVLKLSRHRDRGIWRVRLDGHALGRPIDLYRDERDLYEYHMIDFWPEPGEHTVRLECTGKSEDSRSYALGVDSVYLLERLPRVAKFGLLRDHDWTRNPVLYQRARPGLERIATD